MLNKWLGLHKTFYSRGIKSIMFIQNWLFVTYNSIAYAAIISLQRESKAPTYLLAECSNSIMKLNKNK